MSLSHRYFPYFSFQAFFMPPSLLLSRVCLFSHPPPQATAKVFRVFFVVVVVVIEVVLPVSKKKFFVNFSAKFMRFCFVLTKKIKDWKYYKVFFTSSHEISQVISPYPSTKTYLITLKIFTKKKFRIFILKI